MTATRRLAAIMAVDVVGYSRLMGEDEAGTALSVREHREAARPIVVGLGGRIVKTMGDGLLLEFPSVVAAVECAVAIQKRMVERNAEIPEAKRIVYRIGVNLGDVLIEGDDILGEGVNIAARLEGICNPGGVLISSTAYEHVRGKIDADFVDLGEKALKNIARPVRVYAIGLSRENSEAARASPTSEKSGPPRLSMVVLPFTNIGGGPEQDYFVDGVTESLTTDLSRLSGSFVIARNTAFTYKGKSFDVKQIGRELNVRYVLEGSVQRGGQRMRVNVQLIDAENGSHLWAERFDKPLADLFEMQDEIVARLANQLSVELIAVEAKRAERTANPDSLDHYFQGLAWFHRGATLEIYDKARFHLRRALELNARNVDALALLGHIDTMDAATLLSGDRAALFAAAETSLDQARALRPDPAFAHCAIGCHYVLTRRAERGIAECERALALDPNLALAHAYIGMGKYTSGRNEEVEAHIIEAMRISPRDPRASAWGVIVGISFIAIGRNAEASHWLSRSLETNASSPIAHFWQAAALANLGRIEEAKAAARVGLQMNPNFTVSRFRAAEASDNPVYLAGRVRVFEGLLLAGVPEE
jgi:TolB-like protein/class 3 adenylate cyclase/Flp pilus assembly protein TadD